MQQFELSTQNTAAIAATNTTIVDVTDVFLRSGLPFAAFYDGTSRLSASPEIISKKSLRSLNDCAEGFIAVMDELCMIIASKPHLLQEYFHFGEVEQALWNISALDWKGIARADVFFNAELIPQILELNSDTPSGSDEAVAMDSAMNEEYIDPWLVNTHLRESWIQAVLSDQHDEHQSEHQAERSTALATDSKRKRVAIVYPTDVPEDMGLLFLYRRWLEDAGCEVLLCAPHNLVLNEQHECEVFGLVVDVLYRHYKTDWWLQRSAIWKNSAAYPSADMLGKALHVVATAVVHKKLRVQNSFATLLTQNKLCLAFMHEELHQFRADSQHFIQKHLPLTRRCTTEFILQLRNEQSQWVLKSDYGCEGSDVIIGSDCCEADWERSLDLMVPERWVAQRFVDCAIDDENCHSNYGIYLMQGRAAGIYVRRSEKATDNTAEVAPVLVRDVLSDPRKRPPTDARNPRELQVPDDSQLLSSLSSELNRAQLCELLKCYEPASEWRAWYLPLVLYSDPHQPATSRALMQCDATRNLELADIQSAAQGLWQRLQQQSNINMAEVLMIVDLQRERALHFAWTIEEFIEPVLQCNNLLHDRGVCDMAGIHAELLEHAGRSRAAKQHRVNNNHLTYAPCLVMDALRLEVPEHLTADAFNNCWIAIVPSAESLKVRGVKHVVYVCENAMLHESDDLHADFTHWQEQGIVLTRCTLAACSDKIESGRVTEWWTERAMKIQKRQTIFSYMFEERMDADNVSMVL